MTDETEGYYVNRERLGDLADLSRIKIFHIQGEDVRMYKITEQQKFLSNSAAQGSIHSRLNEHGLSQQLFKFLILYFMYALRNETVYAKCLS